jgi:hypothetical protein
MTLLGETEAGSAGMQPAEGKPGGFIETINGGTSGPFLRCPKSTSNR